jgi:prevent-host-death family protein
MEITTVNVSKGKRDFNRLVQLASEGQTEVIITKRGKPVAILIPFDGHQKSKRFEGYLKIMAVRDRFVDKGIHASDVYSESRADLEERPCGYAREPFDYTKWREDLNEDLSIEEISQKAMALRAKHAEEEHPADKGKTPCR